MTTSYSIGREVEVRALHYLEQQGLKLLEKNYQIRRGEIDLIMQDKHTIVFIEVRFRHHPQFGKSIESITPLKQRRIINTALLYLQRTDRIDTCPCRFDVLTFDNQGDLETLEWIKDAFQAT